MIAAALGRAVPWSFPLDLDDACGDSPSTICEWVYDRTSGNETAATLADWLVDRPLRVLLLLVATWLVARYARKAVRRFVHRVVTPDTSLALESMERMGIRAPGSLRAEVEESVNDPRREARANSIATVAGSTVSVTIWTIGGLLILGAMGINLAPLIAGAGIAGVALGFGAQKLVQDCIAGFFILVEDQFGIGDVADLGEATGTVERITLRVTTLRSLDGTVWYVPNGEVRRVGNLSQLWSVALVDVDVAYETDLETARTIIQRTATVVCEGPDFADQVIEGPEVLGVEVLGADGITLRLTVKVMPGAQWALQRALREALKGALDASGIEIPFPQRTVWVRAETPDGDDREGRPIDTPDPNVAAPDTTPDATGDE